MTKNNSKIMKNRRLETYAAMAALFLLLPGVPLTTSIRELTNGDLISGTARMSEAMITLITIAAGVYTAFTLLPGRLL